MITELVRADFHQLESLLDESVLGVEARAVVWGNNPGWIFVDSAERPRSALVWSRGIEGFYLLGDPDNSTFVDSLDRYVEQSIRPHLVPHWDCMQTNTASASLAEKLGLTRVREYSLYGFSFEK